MDIIYYLYNYPYDEQTIVCFFVIIILIIVFLLFRRVKKRKKNNLFNQNISKVENATMTSHNALYNELQICKQKLDIKVMQCNDQAEIIARLKNQNEQWRKWYRHTVLKEPERTYSSNSNYEVGVAFEEKIHQLLISSGFTRVFHDKRIFEGGKQLSQNDILLVDEVGIFVIECKNWSGEIWGNSSWMRWLKIKGFNPFGHYVNSTIRVNAIELDSPIMQNQYHKDILKNSLNNAKIFDVPLFSIIVFNNTSVISNIKKCTEHFIMQEKDVVSEIKRIIKYRTDNRYRRLNQTTITAILKHILYQNLN